MRRILTKRCPCLVIMVAVMVGLLASGCFGPGTFRVGVDIQPGTYRNSDSSGGCVWERLSGFGNTPEEIIASNFTHDPEVVTISPTDVGFFSGGCGVWTLVAPVPTVVPPVVPTAVPTVAYCPRHEVQVWWDQVYSLGAEISSIQDAAAQQYNLGPFANFVPLRDQAAEVGRRAAALYVPPCAITPHKTFLRGVEYIWDSLDAGVDGNYALAATYVQRADTLLLVTLLAQMEQVLAEVQ